MIENGKAVFGTFDKEFETMELLDCNGSISEAETKCSAIKYINNLQDYRCSFSGFHFNKINKIEYEFDLKRVSLPSVVSIPFGPNRPLYTQKDLFKAKGRLVLNDEVFESNDHTTAIIDDHIWVCWRLHRI